LSTNASGGSPVDGTMITSNPWSTRG
jgi:hypothetical protein